jgi:hypothetical protein
MNLEVGSIQRTNPYKIFLPEKYIPNRIDQKIVATNVLLSLNINCPWQGQTQLMGTMNHEYHGMLRLLKLRRVYC